MCICIVCICGASSFSYRSMQHISTWLLANAFTRESPKSVQALLLQTRQDGYSAQPPQKRAHIIVIAAGREYCHASRCHSLMSLSLLQGGSITIPAGATISYHHHCCREGVLPCQQVPLSHVIVIAAGREYCYTSRCHSLSTRCLLQHLHSP